jgi:hypothetical protein
MKTGIGLLVVCFFPVLVFANAECHWCNAKIEKSHNFCMSCGRDRSKVGDFSNVSADMIPRSKSDTRTPLKLSLATMYGLPWDDKCSVYGIDIAGLVSKNFVVFGIGLSGLAGYSREAVGLFASGCGVVTETCVGASVGGLVSVTKEMSGMQIACGNESEILCGIQIGFQNRATVLRGLQIGVMNYSGNDTMGVQIGIFNYLGVKENELCLPIMNMRF